MADSSIDTRPEARLPKGFRDIQANDLRAESAMLSTIRDVYDSYGFEPLETPAVEFTDALGKFLPDEDRPNAGVFSFRDEDKNWLSLRYDLTAPLARYVAENFDRLPKPFRRYAAGPVWRNEKPGPGRFRQFTQFDADTVGTDSVAADAEMCMLAADTLEALGIKRGDYVIKVNNRKILDGVLEIAGLSGEINFAQRLTVLRALDKFDRLGESNVRSLLGAGRTDESGDFTKGANLNADQIDLLLRFLLVRSARPLKDITDDRAEQSRLGPRSKPFRDMTTGNVTSFFKDDNPTTVDYLRTYFGKSARATEGIDELEQISRLARVAGYEEDQIVIDPAVVRGLEYYTGPVFEAELTFEVKNENGQPVRFGSVGGGGRYDDLVARFTGRKVPATGFSIGVSRLQAALAALPRSGEAVASGPVVVLVMDKAELPRYQRMAQMLRAAGVRAEMYLGSSGMKAQMKYADKRGAPCVVIQGSEELQKGEVQIKDLIEGAKAAANIKDNKEWKASRPAQFSVPEEKLVEAVQEIVRRRTT